MNATKLMIGDWVYIAKINHLAQVVGITTDSIETTYEEGYYNEVFFDSIPLIPDILEKNGFTLFNQIENNIVYKYLLDNIQQNSAFITIVNNTEIYYSYDSDDDNSVISFLPIQYVHELQHALKLCGIVREIVL